MRRVLILLVELAFVFPIFPVALRAKEEYSYPSPCGDGHTIKYPFHMKGDSNAATGDADRRYELGCETNRTILNLYNGKYWVEGIFYKNLTMRIVDTGLSNQNCSSLPRHSLTPRNFSENDPYFIYSFTSYYTFMNCPTSVDNPSYVDTATCFNRTISGIHTYAHPSEFNELDLDIPDLCSYALAVPSLRGDGRNLSYIDIHERLMMGFYISWSVILCGDCRAKGGNCQPGETAQAACYNRCEDGLFQSCYCFFFILHITLGKYYKPIISLACTLVGRGICGIGFMLSILLCMLRRKHLSMDDTIEEFLRNYKSIMPTRYSLSDISKMTKGFKEKLGQGGYGSVYKGMLPDGRLIAIKMLGKCKGNGQDFINEVATIGKIHHVNVVRLIGFCSEKSNRALIYEFMSNGSLDKHIFPEKETDIPLSWEKMNEIALGVARGIGYLHTGCAMKILHFDIKPHNILLDDKFIPKVSDFGLALFYPTDVSIVSITAARGTIGYMAPELFYRNIGSVSYKSDVYSFGMLLMEMAARKKNVNERSEYSSQNYFPSWTFNQLHQGRDIEMVNATEIERTIARKLIIVALWCIQMKPTERPSMDRVVEMLEGDIDLLQMPPNPFLSAPNQLSFEFQASNTNSDGISIVSHE